LISLSFSFSRSLIRLSLKNNSLRGVIDGLAPCLSLETIDLSGNVDLVGEVPPGIYKKVRTSIPRLDLQKKKG
jgi:hypothetical protein